MTWFDARRKIDVDVPDNQFIVSTAIKKIQELTAWQARRYRIIPSSETEFEVFSLATNVTHTVKLTQQKCTCFQWQSTGIPCAHTIAVILFSRHDPQTFTQNFFSLEGYRKTYANAILSPHADKLDNVPDFTQASNGDTTENNGEEGTLAPPHVRCPPGRPRVRRIRSGVEGPFGNKRAKRCGRCGGLGHTQVTCDSAV